MVVCGAGAGLDGDPPTGARGLCTLLLVSLLPCVPGREPPGCREGVRLLHNVTRLLVSPGGSQVLAPTPAPRRVGLGHPSILSPLIYWGLPLLWDICHLCGWGGVCGFFLGHTHISL